MRNPSIYRAFGFLCATIFALSTSAAEPSYDPLAVPKDWKAETIDLVVKDTTRDREIPLRVYLPSAKTAAPVILFSHGLGGARENNPYLGQHWSARGYVVVFTQHVGSDESVWKDAAALQRLAAMKKAANLQNLLLRLKDIPAVIDQLEKWNAEQASPLFGRLDLQHLGMSGHSFGAVTTQGVSGQKPARGDFSFTEQRIKAAIAMSPSTPKGGGDPQKIFGEVKIPWLLMTGTNDIALIGDTDLESRLAVFPALPPGSKYQLVLDGAEHEAFGDRKLPSSQKTRNPNHHRVILATSTAFWDAYLRDDKSARAWLDGPGPSTVMEKADKWEKK